MNRTYLEPFNKLVGYYNDYATRNGERLELIIEQHEYSKSCLAYLENCGLINVITIHESPWGNSTGTYKHRSYYKVWLTQKGNDLYYGEISPDDVDLPCNVGDTFGWSTLCKLHKVAHTEEERDKYKKDGFLII